MKKTSKILGLMMVIVMLSSMLVSAYAAEYVSPTGYTITKLGTIEDESEEICLDYGLPMILDVDGNGRVVAADGSVLDIVVTGIEALLDGYYAIDTLLDGIYIIKDDSGDVNSLGVVNGAGELLIPCEAASIDCMNDGWNVSERYILVTYAQNEVETAAEAIIKVREEETDVYYNGYALVYDVKTQCFVDGVEIMPGESVLSMGDHFCVIDDKKTRVYDHLGERIFTVEDDYPDVCGGYMIYEDEDWNEIVIDANGEELYAPEDYVYMVGGETPVLYRSFEIDGSFYENIYTMDGMQIGDSPYVIESNASGNLVMVAKEGDEGDYYYGLVTLSGEEITSFSDANEYFYYMGHGYWCGKVTGGNVHENIALYSEDGLLANGLQEMEMLVFYEEGSNNYKIYVLNDRDFSLKLKEIVEFDQYEISDVALVLGREKKTGDIGLYETFGGTQLLDNEYEEIHVFGGYVYAYCEGIWDIYELKLVYPKAEE